MSTRFALNLFAVLLVVLATLAGTLAEPCTFETCPPGPVYARFSTQNCSDSPVFEAYTDSRYDTCLPNGPEFVSYNVSAAGVTEYHGNSETCSTAEGIYFLETFRPFYACNRLTIMMLRGVNARDVQSWMVLPNVNATFQAQNTTVELDYPNVNVIRQELQCNDVNDCARPYSFADFWTSLSYQGSCAPYASLAVYNVSYDGTCYRQGDVNYVSYQCRDQTSVITKKYIGNGCQHVIESETVSRVCDAVSNVAFNCTATPLPPVADPISTPFETPDANTTTPSTVPASTTTVLPSFFLIAIAVALTLF